LFWPSPQHFNTKVHTVIQVSSDGQLLDTAKDCFYFVTEFFDLINTSATHIYQSALELTPLSSIVRKLHYHRRLTLFPRVEIGIPDSREPTTTIACENAVTGSSGWSPCGKFIAIQTEGVAEIRDALTSELVSTLQHNPCRDARFLDAPSYSPDGQTLACSLSTGIIIWDIQTGGVAKIIQSKLSGGRPVWSSDGRVVGVLSDRSVNMYDIASGSELPSITLKSDGYLWTHSESFRVMTVYQDKGDLIIEIFEVGPALKKIESFSIQMVADLSNWSFSQTTYRIAISLLKKKRSDGVVVLDIQTLRKLLVSDGNYPSHIFSSDGRYFGASNHWTVNIWNYAGDYIPWRRFYLPFMNVRGICGFSPSSSSILVGFKSFFRIWHLDSPPITPTATSIPQLDIFSRSGTLIATASYLENTITITNCLSQPPSQFIDTGTRITGFGITGNVLLVQSYGVVTAWLLTEDAFVHDVLGRRAGRGDSIWTLPVSARLRTNLKFTVDGETGVVKYGTNLHVYNSRTGEVLDSAQELPRFGGSWYSFNDNLQVQDDHCSGLGQDLPPKYKWKRSDTTWCWKDGWLKDSQGKCLLWLPSDWRVDWRSNMEWFPDISTIKFKSHDGKPTMIKLH